MELRGREQLSGTQTEALCPGVHRGADEAFSLPMALREAGEGNRRVIWMTELPGSGGGGGGSCHKAERRNQSFRLWNK